MANPIAHGGRLAGGGVYAPSGHPALAVAVTPQCRVHRAVMPCVDPDSGLACGHVEVAKVAARDYARAVSRDPSLADFAWVRLGDDMVGHLRVRPVIRGDAEATAARVAMRDALLARKGGGAGEQA